MPNACYSPTWNIKNPFLGASWKVWTSSRHSKVPLCRKLSPAGCLHNGSAINHHFWSVLPQASCRSHRGNKTTGLKKCSTFSPWGCCSKIISPSGHRGWKWFHAFTSGLNAVVIIYGHKTCLHRFWFVLMSHWDVKGLGLIVAVCRMPDKIKIVP